MNDRVAGAESLELYLKTVGCGEGTESIEYRSMPRNWTFLFRNNGSRGPQVIAFSRNQWPLFLVAGWYFRLRGLGRQVLCIDDGLLSSYFFADRPAGYRAFSSRHLPSLRGWRSRLRRLAPLSLRAAERYLVLGVFHSPPVKTGTGGMAKPFDFLFYSNQGGKHLFLATEDLVRGRGVVGKTAWNETALEVAAREFQIVESLSRFNSKRSCVPRPAGCLAIGERDFFLEEYIGGTTLRDVLTDPRVCRNWEKVRMYLERQDQWFAGYRRSFEGSPRSLALHYAPLFDRYQKHWPAETNIHAFNRRVGVELYKLSAGHPGLIPGIAHNDLWPGNFILQGERLVVVDWERSHPEGACVFDYFWMVISAAIEIYMAQKGFHDYSRGFRAFLGSEEPVCRESRERLAAFLTDMGLNATLLRMFLYLFLMEWSVQGVAVFGYATPMDRLAHEELKHFLSTNGPILGEHGRFSG